MQIHGKSAGQYQKFRNKFAGGHKAQVLCALETWASNLENMISQGKKICGGIVRQTCPALDDPTKANRAYRILCTYWVHRDCLHWETFSHVPDFPRHPARKGEPRKQRLPNKNTHEISRRPPTISGASSLRVRSAR